MKKAWLTVTLQHFLNRQTRPFGQEHETVSIGGSALPRFVHLRSIPGKEGLRQPQCQFIHRRKDSLLWIGTSDGLNLYNKIAIPSRFSGKRISPLTEWPIITFWCFFKGFQRDQVGWYTRAWGFQKWPTATTSNHWAPLMKTKAPPSISWPKERMVPMARNRWGGLWKYDPKKPIPLKLTPAPRMEKDRTTVTFFHSARQSGNIWIGTPTGGSICSILKRALFCISLMIPITK